MKKILLIEDEKLAREIYVRKLKDEGFIVFEAITTDEAGKFLQKEKLDLIILDVLLPKENGFDYLERLRRVGANIPPVIVLSNLEGEEYRKKAQELEVKNYFLKTDYVPSEIVKLIKQYL